VMPLTRSSGTATTMRQSVQVQHVSFRTHVPCSKTANSIIDWEPHAWQVGGELMPIVSAGRPSWFTSPCAVETDAREESPFRRFGAVCTADGDVVTSAQPVSPSQRLRFHGNSADPKFGPLADCASFARQGKVLG
jgi:hypothetical protein